MDDMHIKPREHDTDGDIGLGLCIAILSMICFAAGVFVGFWCKSLLFS